MVKRIKVSDTQMFKVETAKHGESGDPFVRVQPFWKKAEEDDDEFKPSRGGVSIPLGITRRICKAVAAVTLAAESDPESVKVLEGNQGSTKGKKKVVGKRKSA